MANMQQIAKWYSFENGVPSENTPLYAAILATLAASGVSPTENFVPVACEVCGANSELCSDHNWGEPTMRVGLPGGDWFVLWVLHGGEVALRYDSFAVGEATLFAPYEVYVANYSVDEHCTCTW